MRVRRRQGDRFGRNGDAFRLPLAGDVARNSRGKPPGDGEQVAGDEHGDIAPFVRKDEGASVQPGPGPARHGAGRTVAAGGNPAGGVMSTFWTPARKPLTNGFGGGT